MQLTVNGNNVALTDEGRGDPLLFVHGFPLSRGVWDPQVAAFKASHRVIAPDLRGLGGSGTQPGTIVMAQYADDLHALIGQLDIGPVVLIGHSMGGYIALAFAQKYPGLLRGLALVGTKSSADTPEAADGRRVTAAKVRTEGIHVVVDAMAPKMLAADNPDAAMAARVRGFMAASTPDGVVGALLGMADRPDSTALLSALKIPVLIVTGDADALVPPAESEKMAAAIPGATLQIIPGAGHLVAYEKPEAFNTILKEWLQSAQ